MKRIVPKIFTVLTIRPRRTLRIQVGFNMPTYLSVLSTDEATRNDVHGESTIYVQGENGIGLWDQLAEAQKFQ